jgi:pentatricopeptide repeat protein
MFVLIWRGARLPDNVTYNSLMSDSCENGVVGDADKMFEEMSERGLVLEYWGGLLVLYNFGSWNY